MVIDLCAKVIDRKCKGTNNLKLCDTFFINKECYYLKLFTIWLIIMLRSKKELSFSIFTKMMKLNFMQMPEIISPSWWKGIIGDKEGIIPSSFVYLLSSPFSESIALYDYKAEPSAQIPQLSIKYF
jgi:hypothetical protein